MEYHPTTKLLDDDISFFSVVHVTQPSNELNDYLRKFHIGPTNGKCPLILVSLLLKKLNILIKLRLIHTPAIFNNMPVLHSSCQKHFSEYLDEKLNFTNHIKENISKASKGAGILRTIYNALSRNSLITIYKSFIWPHLDYGAIIFDQTKNKSFCKNINSIQYNVSLAVTGAIECTSWKKVYKELALKTLKSRKWLKKLCCFYQIKNNGFLCYLADLIPSESHLYNIRNTRNITTYSYKTDAFKYSFFPWTINDWNKVNFNV